jgi:hypothetical protein
MTLFKTLLTVALAGLSLAQPVTRRQEKGGAAAGGLTDLQILQLCVASPIFPNHN